MVMGRNRALLFALSAMAVLLVLAALSVGGCSKASVSQESASYMSYDAAFAQDYPVALEAARLRAEDVKLIAVKSDDFTLPGSKTSWVFLFFSLDRVSAYTVTVVDGKAKVRDNPGMSMLRSSFESIPDISDMAYDADEAYKAVVRCIEGTGKIITCRAYIAAYVGDDDSGSIPAGKWVFIFNDPQDVRNAAMDKTGEISPERCFFVDARTGEVSEAA